MRKRTKSKVSRRKEIKIKTEILKKPRKQNNNLKDQQNYEQFFLKEKPKTGKLEARLRKKTQIKSEVKEEPLQLISQKYVRS